MSVAAAQPAGYSGWVLTARAGLLAALEAAGAGPRHEVVVCEHVTYRYPDDDLAPALDEVRVVAVAADARVQALMAEVAGQRVRPDGRIFHITYSIAEGVPPVQSNQLLARCAGEPIIPIRVPVMAFWRPVNTTAPTCAARGGER